MDNSYRISIGIASPTWLNTSGGVKIAAIIKITTIAILRLFDKLCVVSNPTLTINVSITGI